MGTCFERPKKYSFLLFHDSAYNNYVILAVGLYSSNFEQRAMASVDVLGLNTLLHGCALIIGNLNSFERYKKYRFSSKMIKRRMCVNVTLSCIVGVHFSNLFSCWCSKNFDNLD